MVFFPWRKYCRYSFMLHAHVRYRVNKPYMCIVYTIKTLRSHFSVFGKIRLFRVVYRMNGARLGIMYWIDRRHAPTFHSDLHTDLRAPFGPLCSLSGHGLFYRYGSFNSGDRGSNDILDTLKYFFHLSYNNEH